MEEITVEEITEEEFISYEKVRVGGKTNMFDVSCVSRLSKPHLSRDKIITIMKNYGKLMKKFPEVRK